MLHLCIILYVFVLFILFTPGVFLSLPPNGSKMIIAMTHAVVFAIVLSFTYSKVSALVNDVSEGFFVLKKRTLAGRAGGGVGTNPFMRKPMGAPFIRMPMRFF
jgi:hypothetical protein